MLSDAGAAAPPREAAREPQDAALDFTPFSRPDAASPAVAGAIIRAYAPAIVGKGLEAWPEAPEPLAVFLEHGVGSVTGFDLGWDFGLGEVHEALEDGRSTAEGLIDTALHLLAHGVEGVWRADAGRRRPWRFGPLLLPPARRLEAAAADGKAVLRLDDQVLRLDRDPLGWRAVSEGPVELPWLTTGEGRPFARVLAGGGFYPFDPQYQAMLSPEAGPHFLPACQGALAQIARAAPAYLPWVTQAVNTIVPCRAKPDTLSSGSSARMPGVVRVTEDRRPEALLEMLVHEASHQYFYLAGLVGVVSDPADRRLFFSPVKQSGRTIDRILLAYHAFANVEAAFAGCIAGREGDLGYYGPQFEKLIPQLDLMEQHMLAAGSLTPLGWDLVRPLIERRGRS